MEGLLPAQRNSVVRQRVTEFYRRPDFDPKDDDFEPVLVDLLNHPDFAVRCRAAEELCKHGANGCRQAVPVLIDVYEQHPLPGARYSAAQAMAQNAVADQATAEAVTSRLLHCHEIEANQDLRNALVETLRKIDPEAKDLPPLVYDFNHPEHQLMLGGFVDTVAFFERWVLQSLSAGDDSGWNLLPDPTTPSGGRFVLTRMAGSPFSAVHAIVARYPPPAGGLALRDPESWQANVRNIELRVSIKALGGTVQPGGGLLWRCSDAGNYYAAGIDPVDRSLWVDRRVNRKSVQLGCNVGLNFNMDEWHTLSIKHVDDKIECFLDGNKHLEVRDSSITRPGTFGLWTTADAQTDFDGLRVIDYGAKSASGSAK
jgi:hypothetical protein